MFKLEYKRYLFSKSTLIFLLVITVISTISWGASLSERQIFIDQYYDYAHTDRWELISNFIYHYRGWSFLYNLWFNSGATAIKIYFIYAWIGVFLSSQLHAEKANRFGSLIITRMSYKQRLHHILSTQSLYITTIVGAYVLISFIGSLILGGIPHGASPIGTAYYGWLAWLGIAFLQFLWLSFAFVIINAFCLLLNMWIKQKYILQVIPFVLFVIVPTMLWPMTLNSAPALFELISGFHVENTMLALWFLFQDWGFDFFLRSAQTVIVATGLAAILYPLHIRKGARDYL